MGTIFNLSHPFPKDVPKRSYMAPPQKPQVKFTELVHQSIANSLDRIPSAVTAKLIHEEIIQVLLKGERNSPHLDMYVVVPKTPNAPLTIRCSMDFKDSAKKINFAKVYYIVPLEVRSDYESWRRSFSGSGFPLEDLEKKIYKCMDSAIPIMEEFLAGANELEAQEEKKRTIAEHIERILKSNESKFSNPTSTVRVRRSNNDSVSVIFEPREDYRGEITILDVHYRENQVETPYSIGIQEVSKWSDTPDTWKILGLASDDDDLVVKLKKHAPTFKPSVVSLMKEAWSKFHSVNLEAKVEDRRLIILAKDPSWKPKTNHKLGNVIASMEHRPNLDQSGFDFSIFFQNRFHGEYVKNFPYPEIFFHEAEIYFDSIQKSFDKVYGKKETPPAVSAPPKSVVNSESAEKIKILETLASKSSKPEVKALVETIQKLYESGDKPDEEQLKRIRNYLYVAGMRPQADHFRVASASRVATRFTRLSNLRS